MRKMRKHKLALLGLTLTLLSVTSAPVDDFIQLVEKQAGSLTPEQLNDDGVVTQEVAEGHTIYRHTQAEKHGYPIFVRKGSDEGKAVIVFKEGEDFLPICGPKQTFVVLKQGGAGSKDYRILFAYVRTSASGANSVEWETWSNRGSTRNKALAFGFARCSESSMVPCKKDAQLVTDDNPDYEDFGPAATDKAGMPPLPYTHPAPRIIADGGSAFFCDLGEASDQEKRFEGGVIGALTQAMAVLTGAEVLYSQEEEMLHNVKESIKADAEKSKAPAGKEVNATAYAEHLMNVGRSTVSGGTLMFYAAVVKEGALAVNETPIVERLAGSLNEAQTDDLTDHYKSVGLSILRGLFQGIDFDDAEQKSLTPNPKELLNEKTVEGLVEGRSIGESIDAGKGEGRSVLGWITGKADVGSSSNSEQAIRQYKGVEKDGSVTGSKAIDNLNFAIDNAFSGNKKSGGQVFSENLVAGVYTPFGVIEDVGDNAGGSVLGVGRASEDKSYIEDLHAKVFNVVGGAAGQVVDVVGDVLGPIGLGGLWTGVAGVTAAGLGITYGVAGSVVGGPVETVKVGAKALGIGGIIGMNGAGSRAPNIDGTQNNDRNTQGVTAMGKGNAGEDVYFGRRKRAAEVNKHLDIGAITDVDLFSQLGWRTANIRQEVLATTVFSPDAAYFGFGNCLYKPPTTDEINNAKSGKEAMTLYFRSMRVNCLKDQMESINDAVSKGFLKFNAQTKVFDVPDPLSALSSAKLSGDEISFLLKAFEMAHYSKAFKEGLKKPDKGTQLGATLRSMILNYLQEAETRAPTHYVKLARNAGKLAKTALTKSLQDFFRYKYCRKCNEMQMTDTLDDCVLFSGLFQFVVKGQEDAALKGMGKKAAFDTWFGTERETISKKLSLYFV